MGVGFSSWTITPIEQPIVLHIPHASTVVPDHAREQFVISEQALDREIAKLTDHHTDYMFSRAFPSATACVFPVSRFVIDAERFEDDSREPMAATGMGVIYTRGIRPPDRASILR